MSAAEMRPTIRLDRGFPVRTLVSSGVDYCRAHAGIRNEDQARCDFGDPTDPEQRCRTCEGFGVSSDGERDCDDCDGEGVTPCDLTPLFYEPADNASSVPQDAA